MGSKAVGKAAPAVGELRSMQWPAADESVLDIGRCCACQMRGASVRNVLFLDVFAPVSGTGWGCSVCALPRDGAVAALCDACMAAGADVTEVVNGSLTGGERMPYRECRGHFAHVMQCHLRRHQQKEVRTIRLAEQAQAATTREV